MGPEVWGGGAGDPKPTYLVITASPSPSTHTVDGEDLPVPKPQALPLLPVWPGLLVSRAAARGSLLSRPEPPLHRVTPADAPRLWPEPHPEHSPEHRCSRSLVLEQLLGKITESAFHSLPLSGENWGHSLLWSQAPGYLPWVPVQTADHAALVCVVGSCLKVPVGRQVS